MRKVGLAALAAIMLCDVANASLTFTFSQAGSDIAYSGTGSFVTTGFTGQAFTGSLPAQVDPYYGVVAVGVTAPVTTYVVASAASGFGTSKTSYSATSATGTAFGFDAASGELYLPIAYVSGSVLSGTGLITNATFAQLGVSAGTYTYTLNNRDTVTVNIIGGSVPEPASWAIMAAGFGAIGSAMRRRRKVAVRFA